MTRLPHSGGQGLRVAVVGGGIVGACASLVIAQAGHRVTWYAPGEPARRADGAQARAYALAPGTVQFLESLGVWAQVRARARPVVCMEVYARPTDPQPIALAASDVATDALAQILGHAELLQACEQAAQMAPNILRDPRFPLDISVGNTQASAILRLPAPDTAQMQPMPQGGASAPDEDQVPFDLVIATDGAGSFLRRRAGLLWGLRDYGQTALVMALESSVAHQGVACQWFLENAVLALLPLEHERQLSMVYSLPTREADQWMLESAQEIARRVGDCTGQRWGELAPLSLPVSSPLVMTTVEQFALGRLLLVGDAAHTVHPLAGYGLNLGLQDLQALRACLQAGLPASDAQLPTWLGRFGRQRVLATRTVQWGLDGLWRAMRLELPGMEIARRLGSQGIRAMPWLRRWLIRQAMGPQLQ
jgi:2-polyprenylphenol 6-hydroxylase